MPNGRHVFFAWRRRRRARLATLIGLAILAAAPARAEGATRAVTLVSPQKPSTAGGPENPAGLTIEISPGEHIPLGSKVAFRVSARAPGYLILIEADAAGKVTQRYPNIYSMALPAGAGERSNLLQPGRPALIPNRFNPFAAFEYVAEPPAGSGLFVALLSPSPVHVVDLPDVPAELRDPRQAKAFLVEAARRLRIAGDGGLKDPRWSIATQPYEITP
ncbi:DUF4384 domain-containing protein [Methylocella sp.]|uniref:DUF4384 domain-containing protein n=1 Tax=Methylocella sp. TaxID=1978226 RepID=UPI0037842EC1